MAAAPADESPRPSSSSSSSSSSGADEEMQVESLVAGRQRRSTAGTRMSTLIAEEEEAEDDDLKLLFAEAGDDDGQEDMEFDDDAQGSAASAGGGASDDDDMGSSSSSDEDQGPAAGADDLEGEKELEKEAREERRKKRRAQEAFTKKRPRQGRRRAPTTTTEAAQADGEETTTRSAGATAAARPKKKSERVSWLPTPEEGPLRQSSRKQTVQNKQVVHERMRQSEKRRRRQLLVMEEAAKRKEAERPKAMTQEDRLAEAAKAEARNAKSLNRWEAAEEKRVEEQREKIAALKRRKLEGPVISWWSGPGKWVDGRLVGTGKKVLQKTVATESSPTNDENEPGTTQRDATPLLDGEHDRATSTAALPGDSHLTELSTVVDETPPQPITSESDDVKPDLTDVSTHPSGHPRDDFAPLAAGIPLPSAAPPLEIEIASRNLVILEKIDANSKIPALQDHVLLRKKHQVRPLKPVQELCTITGDRARFRDPRTGVSYANSKAYSELQKLASGSAQWSTLLGCYIGPVSTAARGVPAQFTEKK